MSAAETGKHNKMEVDLVKAKEPQMKKYQQEVNLQPITPAPLQENGLGIAFKCKICQASVDQVEKLYWHLVQVHAVTGIELETFCNYHLSMILRK